MLGEREFNFPQRLEPNIYGGQIGTAEAVPFQIILIKGSSRAVVT